MGLQKLACAELRVKSVAEAVAFNTEIFGLTEIAGDGRRRFFTCGADGGSGGSAQLILVGGGTGVASFTFSVDAADDLEMYAGRLGALGVECEKRTDAAPGQGMALVFTLPTGQRVELAPEPDRAVYPHPARDRAAVRRGVGADDIDHITLAFGTTASGTAAVRVLSEGLGFAVSDLVLDSRGEWVGAWTRAGELHHDVGLIRCQRGASLHHVAWTLRGAEHLNTAVDVLASAGHGLETGPGRHGVGGNLYAYFWAPGGNRYELSAEMPRVVGDRREPLVHDATSFNSFSAWGISRPDSFTRGS